MVDLFEGGDEAVVGNERGPQIGTDSLDLVTLIDVAADLEQQAVY